MRKFFTKEKLIEFLKKNEQKIVLMLAFILVAAVSFEAGILKGRENKPNPLVIEKPAEAQVVGEATRNNSSGSENLKISTETSQSSAIKNISALPHDCAFVGSKNSNKYHLPTCSSAKRIKPENIVCFSSVEDALKKGYFPDNNCIKQ